MASKRDLEQLVGKLVLDEQFRQDFLADPQRAAEQLGIKLKDKEIEKAKSVKGEDLDRIAKEADQIGVQGAYAWGGTSA